MRELDISSKRHTFTIELNDCHRYKVLKLSAKQETPGIKDLLADVIFQEGPIKEVGVNGCQVEDIIAIAIDKLRFFQKGGLNCRDNAIAITHLEEALFRLNHRSRDREKRGVEGTMEA